MSPSTPQAWQAPKGAARRAAPGAASTTVVAALALAFLAGCASGPDATWSDPQLGAKPLQGARVLVVCEAAETTLQQLCLDRMTEEAMARGLTPVRPAQPPAAAGVGRGADAYVGAARAAGATALLLTSVTPDSAQVSRPSPFSIGIGGFGWGGGHVGAGVGVSVPIGGGGYASNPGYAANSSFTEAGSGRLLWSARTSTTTSDFNAGMGTMARTLMEAAEKAGVF
ncbi:hypothetical protein [uncultured Azohydromonas sp.]|uniref:hypothetical protein n=1 Tax=uncultured Azohydromonas sp. TaxID=487342 RepID=UPI002635BF0F|nr:hypothetical protein [uncultured Azohydromonas sp.]